MAVGFWRSWRTHERSRVNHTNFLFLFIIYLSFMRKLF